MNEQSGTTVGQAKETWGEVMFYLALFFGMLHFSTVLMQVAGMFMYTVLKKDIILPFQSSMLMGHTYLAFLAAYVGQKEFVRWLKRGDDEILSEADAKKITRGIYIVVSWSVFMGVTLVLKSGQMIAEVPETLVYTLGEVLALFCGSEASKYLRSRQAIQKKQDAGNNEKFGTRAVDFCKEKGSIDNRQCQIEFGLSQDQSSRFLAALVKSGKLKAVGSGPARKYVAV